MAVIWLILKWIGIILLFLLGLFLLLLFTVLFCALRYRLEASYYGKADLELDVRWLFSLISIKISFHDGNLAFRVRICGKTILTEGAEAENSETENPPQSAGAVPSESPPKAAESVSSESPPKAVASVSSESLPKADGAVSEEGSSKTEKTDFTEPRTEEKKGEKSAFKKKITFSIRKICDKIKAIGEKKEQVQAFLEDPENKKAFALIKRQLFRLFRHILPRHFTARLHFGFEDPALTGQVLGYICMFYALYGNNLSLEPDFQEKVLEGECRIKGRIRPGCLLGIVGRLFFQKRIRSWIFQFMK